MVSIRLSAAHVPGVVSDSDPLRFHPPLPPPTPRFHPPLPPPTPCFHPPLPPYHIDVQMLRQMRALATVGAREFATKAESTTINGIPVVVHNAGGSKRVVVTKDLPGERWLDILAAADCRIEVRPCTKYNN